MSIERERRDRLWVPRPVWWTLVGLIGILLAMTWGAPEAWAATRTVPTSPNCGTIQDCVDTSDPGDTIQIRPGRYNENVVVDKELTIRGTSCSARRVIVDASPGGVNGVGFDLLDAADGTEIRCLFVRHGSDGIRATDNSDVDDLSLSSVIVEGSGDDNVVVEGDGLRVSRSRFISSNDQALEVTGNDAEITGATALGHNTGCVEIIGNDALVASSRIERCEDHEGIEISGHNAVVNYNTVLSTDAEGIEVDGDNAAVSRNTVRSVDDIGIKVSGEAPRITRNTASGRRPDDVNIVAAAFNIVCDGTCEDGLVERNTAIAGVNEASGFFIQANGGVTGLPILNNTATDNAENGFNLDVDEAVIRGNTALRNGSEREDGFIIQGDANTIANNRSDENNGDGFELFSGDDNVFENNRAEENSRDGFDIDDGNNILNTLLEGNRATDNQAEGFDNGGQATDIINNRFSGNRIDCANGGTIDVNTGNVCSDGSDFLVAPEID